MGMATHDHNMADHDQIKDWLPAYVLGSLNADERAKVEAHVRQCDECPQLLADYEHVMGLVRYALPVEVPPEDVRGRIRARVSAARVGEQRPLSWWQHLRQMLRLRQVGMVAASLGVILTLLIWNVQLQQRLNHVQQSISVNGQ